MKYNDLTHALNIRQELLSFCQEKAYEIGNGSIISEESKFNQVCEDELDFVELVMICENKLNIALNDIDNDERSFDTVRDFIDWASSNL